MKLIRLLPLLLTTATFFSLPQTALATEFDSSLTQQTLKKAQQGDVEEQYFICIAYEPDSKQADVTKNEHEAIEWCKKAAEQGHIGAISNLAHLYIKQKKFSLAFPLWQQLSYKSIDDYIAYEKTRIYNRGQDENNIRLIANAYQAEHRFNLAIAYLNGYGTEQDYKKAKYWAVKIVNENHNRIGFTILGNLYQYGRAVRLDKYKAIELYGEACNGGHQYACDQYRKLKELDH
ncbi:tetratricopeptide repeat protein [Conservatibacter flavescens]|uniref:Sel1 repeat family protein n=1 Tax=Conservatibacter flavescens TaxID=28161 RepID=A0A2M8RZM7_9PAST|nr:tetratricopeptide repeat protein [Conservatibacter flavescens]PJG84328.1 hypothetical protein CVP05_12010 [Conservatibacter flavescens]